MNTPTFEDPPESDLPAPTKSEIRDALADRPGKWAVVARADRQSRADRQAESINDGTAYGPGFEAVTRKVGPECRVYARKGL